MSEGPIVSAEPTSQTARSVLKPRTDAPGTISTAELFGGAREIAIDHDGTLYRLRITRQGKLILNK